MTQVSMIDSVRGVLVGLFFVAIVAFAVLGITFAIHRRLRAEATSPVLIASLCLALPYSHFAYSRADISHLAQGVFPFLVGMLAILGKQPARVKWPLASLLCAASMLTMLPVHPGWQCDTTQGWVIANVAGSKLSVAPWVAEDLGMLSSLADRFAPNGRSFVATPFWPGAYAVLKRRSPMWEIYALFPSKDEAQEAEIERIRAARPGFVFVIGSPLDGREELRFQNTHARIDKFIRDEFAPVTGYSRNPEYQIYSSRETMP